MGFMKSRAAGIVAVLAVVLAACSGTGASPSAASVAPASVAPASVAPSSAAPSSAAPATAAAGATVEAKSVGDQGVILVASSNGMTVYNFTKDTADSGTSACTGACFTNWPPLTVPAGGAPVAGTGVTGKLGTITRADNGALQVTYKGLPLYFFSGDKAAGDTKGVYTNWMAVKP